MIHALMAQMAAEAFMKAASDALALQAFTAKNLGNDELAAAFEVASDVVHPR